MHGYLSTEKKIVHWNSLLNAQQLRMLAISVSVGIITGLIITQPYLKLHLGLSGHKALFWMTPVLVARLLGKCKAGTTAGALAAAFTTFAFGGHLGGGIIGLPLVGFTGIICDTTIGFIEKTKLSPWLTIPILGFATMIGNLIMLTKRLLNPTGSVPHMAFEISPFWFDLLSYAFFGLLSGIIAAIIALAFTRYTRQKNNDG
jgi:hypothetical protein